MVKNLFTDWELSVRILADVKNLFYALIAQSVEHAAVNRGVVGSSPTGGARKRVPPQNAAAQLVIMGL